MYLVHKARSRAVRTGLTGLSAALGLFSLFSVVSSPIASAQPAGYDITVADVSVSEGSPAVFQLSVTGTHPTFTVDYETRPGTALATDDYVTTTGTLTIGASDTSGQISVPTVGERVYEPDEEFYLVLSGTTANIVGGRGVGTITNNDPIPQVNISGVSVTEPDFNQVATASFDLTLSNPASQDVSVSFDSVDGTADGKGLFATGGDYTNRSGWAIFPAGTNQTQQVNVTVKGDLTFEGNETFQMNLSNPVNAVLGSRAQATGTIVDDDPQPTLSISASGALNEPDSGTTGHTMVVSLSNPTTQQVTFRVSSSNGAAEAGADFTDLQGNRTMDPGDILKFVTVQVVGDLRFEPDENFFVIIDNPTNAVLGNSVAEVTIINDDPILVPNEGPIDIHRP